MGTEAYKAARINPAELSLPIYLFDRSINSGIVQNIVGIGVDIVDVTRIQEAVEKHPYYKGFIFTADEIDYCERASGILRFERYAARFAGKEAVAKAISGMPHSALDICIITEESGKPVVELRGHAKDYADQTGIDQIFLSLSHIANAAIAFSIAVRRPIIS